MYIYYYFIYFLYIHKESYSNYVKSVSTRGSSEFSLRVSCVTLTGPREN